MRRLTRAFHMAEAANWPPIQRDGLHSASALLERAGLVGEERARLERCQRVTHTVLPNGVQIRHQGPMPPAALARCLIGMSPSEWYALINAHVFFWLDPARLNRQRAACTARPQVVLTVDVDALAETYAAQMALTPINTGNARRQPARRGVATFVPYASWVASAWESEAASLGTPLRPHSHPPAELTVTGSIPDAMRYVVAVQELVPGQPFLPG
jgi:hypothetical protein